MRQPCLNLIAALLYSVISAQAFALAPVVDDSENFAILDEQQADIDQPVIQDQYDQSDYGYNDKMAANDEKPLAHDEPVSKNQTHNQVGLLDKIQGMQQDIQELRGQLEVQSHELKLLKEQQLTYYKDLDARLHQAATATPSIQSKTTTPTITPPSTALSIKNLAQSGLPTKINASHTEGAPTQYNTQATVAPVPATPTTGNHSNPADEQISYMAAYEHIKNKQFDQATIAMEAFLRQYPNGGYSANAQYWLGELYMVKKSYPEAIQHFEAVLTQYPNSSKASASLLKIGYALANSGKTNEAKQKLQQVIKNYPDTTTAQLASAKLKSLNAT